ncbi:hypothetical protein ABT095_26820 [Kitasatospora sp. NPDC002227]|uniref:hypothetical protein n=1 Tax=Kitasatospora sp. NPDC002227 TaxID=3154773 RepID=UPI00331A4E90
MTKRAFLVLLALLVAGCGSGGGGSTAPTSAQPSGNGVESLGAKDIVARSVQTLKDGRSAHLTGQTSSDGQTVTMDLAMDTTGNCAGTVSQTDQGTFKLVKLGKQVWVKPDAAFWQTHGGPATAQLVGDKYLKTSSDNPDFAQLASVCDLNTLADSIGSVDTVTTGGRTTVNGTDAVALNGTKGADSGTVYVAVTGKPYPLRIEKSGGKLDFKDFGTPVPTTTPSPDQSIDLDELNRETTSQSPSASAA